MTQTSVAQRRPAAILVADIVGYTRLMEADENYTYLWQTRLRTQILDPTVAEYTGRMVKNTGDGFIAVFDSARAATECALALQEAVATRTIIQPMDRRITYRMAVNVADIIMEEDDVYGDGVNVAARLQTYAEPGTVVISGAVAERVGEHRGVSVLDLGDLHLRNLGRPVRVLALRSGRGAGTARRRCATRVRAPTVHRGTAVPYAADQSGGEVLRGRYGR